MAGLPAPPHVHPTDEQWIYLLEGRLATILGDEMDIIGPGDLVYIPRGIPHGIRLLGPLCRFFVEPTFLFSKEESDASNV